MSAHVDLTARNFTVQNRAIQTTVAAHSLIFVVMVENSKGRRGPELYRKEPVMENEKRFWKRFGLRENLEPKPLPEP